MAIITVKRVLIKIRKQLEKVQSKTDNYARPELDYQIDVAMQALDEAIAQVTYD
jgi:hypothetical protein